AGRDGLAVTFAESRDRRRIFDIEQFTRQPFKSEVIPGLEPQQRAPRPQGKSGGRDGHPRERKFGGGGHRGHTGASGFNDRHSRSPSAGSGGGRGHEGYGRKTGWGQSAPRGKTPGAARRDGFAPRAAQGRGFKPGR
ncbi:MAG: ATP-dependent helicase, partial [Burkholderiaceae bacterium]|nr:ATP-dependent helicase [Burkholderiaceae bacterium]